MNRIFELDTYNTKIGKFELNYHHLLACAQNFTLFFVIHYLGLVSFNS